MPAAMIDDEPTTFTDAVELVGYMQSVLDSDPARTPAGLRPKVTHFGHNLKDGRRFILSVNGVGFGGRAEEIVELSPEELASPTKARTTFRLAYADLLRKVRENLEDYIRNRVDGGDRVGDAAGA